MSSCGDSTTKETDLSTNIETVNMNENDKIPEYVQQIFNKYGEAITQHGHLVARTGTKVQDNRGGKGSPYSFRIYPTTDNPDNSSVEIFFDREGNQSFYMKVEKFSDSYLEELLVLSLRVIEPEMQSHGLKDVVNRLLTPYREGGEEDIQYNQVVIGEYTIYLDDSYLDLLGMHIYFDSSKTAFEVYDFNKSDYQPLTYDMYTNPESFKNELFYIEGVFGYTADVLGSEIVDVEGNHFILKMNDYILHYGAMYRLYGILKTDVYGDAYFYVEYPYGL